jgi:transketolase
MSELEALQQTALRIREHVLAMAAGSVGAHVGGSLSAADLLTVLYFHVLNVRPDDPAWPERDYFILSKGHAGAGLYATLAERGFFAVDELKTYAQPGGRLLSHPTVKVPGVEFPTGSLGHGLSLGVGLALAAKRAQRSNRTFVLMGDGELQEGSVWEAAMAAPHFGLGNLVAIVDRNRLQISGPTEQRMRLEPLAERWQSFGWSVVNVDGHKIDALLTTFAQLPLNSEQPTVVIARTVKGKGVKFLADRKKSHYVKLTPDLYRRALKELHEGVQL